MVPVIWFASLVCRECKTPISDIFPELSPHASSLRKENAGGRPRCAAELTAREGPFALHGVNPHPLFLSDPGARPLGPPAADAQKKGRRFEICHESKS